MENGRLISVRFQVFVGIDPRNRLLIGAPDNMWEIKCANVCDYLEHTGNFDVPNTILGAFDDSEEVILPEYNLVYYDN